MTLADFHQQFYDAIVKRSHLPAVEDVAAAHAKLNVARILAGATMLLRTILIAAAGAYYFDNSSGLSTELALVLSMIGLLVLFTIGFCTPLATLALLLTYNAVDFHVQTAMLGTSMFTLLLWFFLVASAGSSYSVDAWLLRRNVPILAPFLRALYRWFKLPDARQLRLYLFILFLAYALTNLGAVWHHLSDAYWVGGDTMVAVLTNSYLSKWYVQFRALEAVAPWALRALSVFLLVVQSVFQLFMLPLIFVRRGRHFIVAWGLIFFLGSISLLQLSILPAVQFVLWLVLFMPGKCGEPRPAPGTHLGQRPVIVSVLLILALCANALFLMQMPFVPHTLARHGYFQRLLYLSGFNFPVVFNESDLKLGDKWAVLTRMTADGKEERVPFNHFDGKRAWYHYSDLLYFGNSLRWRRHTIGKDPIVYNAPGSDGYDHIARIVAFDARFRGDRRPIAYRVDIFQNEQSNIRLPAAQRYRARRVLTYTVPWQRSAD